MHAHGNDRYGVLVSFAPVHALQGRSDRSLETEKKFLTLIQAFCLSRSYSSVKKMSYQSAKFINQASINLLEKPEHIDPLAASEVLIF